MEQVENLAEIQADGSSKGVAYTGTDDPALPSVLRRAKAGVRADVHEERLARYIEQHNERWTVVATCETCGEPLIAEEVAQHGINHLARGDARVLAGMYVRASDEVRAAFRSWLDNFKG